MTRGTFRFSGKRTSWLLSLRAFYFDSPPQRQWEMAGEPPSFLRLSISKKKKINLSSGNAHASWALMCFLMQVSMQPLSLESKKLLVVWQGPRCILWSWEPHQRPAPSLAFLSEDKRLHAFSWDQLWTELPVSSVHSKEEKQVPKNDNPFIGFETRQFQQRLEADGVLPFPYSTSRDTWPLCQRDWGGGGVERSKTFLGFSRQS